MIGNRRNSISVADHQFLDNSRIGSPGQTMKGRFNSFRRGKKSVVPNSLQKDLSVEDMINTSLKKTTFGFDGYRSPNNKQMLKNPFAGTKFPKLTVPRQRKDTFITE